MCVCVGQRGQGGISLWGIQVWGKGQVVGGGTCAVHWRVVEMGGGRLQSV